MIKIPQSTRDAVKQLQEKGVHVAIATGARHLCSKIFVRNLIYIIMLVLMDNTLSLKMR